MEVESAFFDKGYRLFRDNKHSSSHEERFIMFAKSLENRVLMVGFTHRAGKVRVITARPASRKERLLYEKA